MHSPVIEYLNPDYNKTKTSRITKNWHLPCPQFVKPVSLHLHLCLRAHGMYLSGFMFFSSCWISFNNLCKLRIFVFFSFSTKTNLWYRSASKTSLAFTHFSNLKKSSKWTNHKSWRFHIINLSNLILTISRKLEGKNN